jgi:stage III sporulation protein SpoIIIAA
LRNAASAASLRGSQNAADPFKKDNRTGISRTLHRISAIRDSNSRRSVVGLTYRIGRHIAGAPADAHRVFHGDFAFIN